MVRINVQRDAIRQMGGLRGELTRLSRGGTDNQPPDAHGLASAEIFLHEGIP